MKVTGTCSWIKLVCHKLACITFLQKAKRFSHQPVSTEDISAIVRHNTNTAAVHSPGTVGGRSVEYVYKLLASTGPAGMKVSLPFSMTMTLLLPPCSAFVSSEGQAKNQKGRKAHKANHCVTTVFYKQTKVGNSPSLVPRPPFSPPGGSGYETTISPC